MAHPSTKQILKQLIDELPDDATIADVQYRLYIIDAVNRGQDEITSGSGIPHAQVATELRAKRSRRTETTAELIPQSGVTIPEGRRRSRRDPTPRHPRTYYAGP